MTSHQRHERNELSFSVGACSLGLVLVAANTRGICAILIGDERDHLIGDLRERFQGAALVEGGPDLEERVMPEVLAFVEEPSRGLKLPLDSRGTAFQQRVWEALRQIPAGETISYTELASLIGSPRAVRAVARACGANPLAVAIPCHRVVRSDGGLSGYRWGIERKRILLDREAGR